MTKTFFKHVKQIKLRANENYCNVKKVKKYSS